MPRVPTRSLVVLSFFAFPLIANSDCKDIGTLSIPLPVYSDRDDSPNFIYSYRIERGAESTPAVIVLGGGPGQATIKPGSAPILGAFPQKLTKVCTDPRSVGCNDNFEFADDALSTQTLANDVASLVEHLLATELKGQKYYV